MQYIKSKYLTINQLEKKNSDNWLFIALKLPNYTTIEMCSENNA